MVENVRGSFFSPPPLLPRFLLYLYAFAREQFSMFGEQIKPLEPQDKSDRRKRRVRRGEPGGGMRAEQKC